MKRIFIMMLLMSVTFITSKSYAQQDVEGIRTAVHVGGAMGFDTREAGACIQFSAGANYMRLFTSFNYTLPGNTDESPKYAQARLGYIIGIQAGPKVIPYVGVNKQIKKTSFSNSQAQALYPERFQEYKLFSAMYGAEFSIPVAPNARVFCDVSFTGKAIKIKEDPINYTYINEETKMTMTTAQERAMNYGPHLVFVIGVKTVLNKLVDCYPTPKL